MTTTEEYLAIETGGLSERVLALARVTVRLTAAIERLADVLEQQSGKSRQSPKIKRGSRRAPR